MRRIDNAEDLSRGAACLIRLEPRFGPVIAAEGTLPLRRKPGGFVALLEAIVSQQVSTASARAIWARLQEAELTSPERVSAAGEEALRAAGLSRPKIRYARALARAGLDYDGLEQMPLEALIAYLTEVPGIGRWTAEIYAIQCIGHADAFAAGDLALQEAARMLFELDKRPNEAGLRALAAPWAPWRAVAARALWAYYRQAKNREGLT